MKVQHAVVKAALDTAELNKIFGEGTSPEEALSAACTANKRQVLNEVIAKADLAGECEDLDPEFRWILHWFADQVRKDLPPDDNAVYEPHDGDAIQVTFTGSLSKTSIHIPGEDHWVDEWDLDTLQGVVIPIEPEDFPQLHAVRILPAGD